MTRIPPSIQKIYKWEFWPAQVFYMPIYLYFAMLAARSRSLTFFSAVNPGMHCGGLIGDSKYETLSKFDKKLLPKTVFVKKDTKIPEILEMVKKQKIEFPIIAKPDIGMRGKGVEKIDNGNDLKIYMEAASENFLIQEYIDLKCEFGVFYVRSPEEKLGKITSLMQRDYLCVVGDGESSLKELILNHDRAIFYKKYLLKRYKSDLDLVLEKGKSKKLGFIGNHCRGTKFMNICDKISPKLEKVFDDLSQKIPGFFYGRYDVKAGSFEELEKGNFKIIELNGANSEPSHIYDPNMKLIKAYKDYFSHWNTLRKISLCNKRQGVEYASLKSVIKDIQNA